MELTEAANYVSFSQKYSEINNAKRTGRRNEGIIITGARIGSKRRGKNKEEIRGCRKTLGRKFQTRVTNKQNLLAKN